MADVIVTDEFTVWWDDLTIKEQAAVERGVRLLEARGVALGEPYSKPIATSRYAMRELRIQHAGQPYRVFYAFDPVRDAVLLIGGNKTGKDRFYEQMVPTADKIWEEYLGERRWEQDEEDS